MNVNRNTNICPVILDSTCVFYSGGNLIYTGINTNDSIQTALIKIDNKFKDASIGYIFNNGVIQSAPGAPVQLGGSLVKNTILNSAGYTFGVTGVMQAASFVTIGGTSSQFVKGDGSLDNTSYQPSGNYITDLTGDGSATGPGSAVFTLANTGVSSGTYGSSSQVPVFTVDGKGRITNVTNTAINYPAQSIVIIGDVTGSGFTGSSVTLTLNTVNANVYTTNTPLKFSVNDKGLVTSAAALTNLDLDSIYGYTPIGDAPSDGQTYGRKNGGWTVVTGGGGPVAWGSITGTITAQTDLITYLSTNYVPQTRNITINGVTYDLSADRTWTITAGVSSVTASSPLASTGGATPDISIQQANGSQGGYLTSADWTTFNNKFNLPSLTAGSVLFSNGTTIAEDNANFFWDDTNNRLGIGTNTPAYPLQVNGKSYFGDNVGIQTTPDSTYRLKVGNGGSIFITSGSDPFIDLNTVGAGSNTWRIQNEYSLGNFNLYEVGASNLSISVLKTSNNVIIGGVIGATTSYKLDVNGTFHTTGQNTLDDLAGASTRMVVADTNGKLSTQTIPIGSDIISPFLLMGG